MITTSTWIYQLEQHLLINDIIYLLPLTKGKTKTRFACIVHVIAFSAELCKSKRRIFLLLPTVARKKIKPNQNERGE